MELMILLAILIPVVCVGLPIVIVFIVRNIKTINKYKTPKTKAEKIDDIKLESANEKVVENTNVSSKSGVRSASDVQLSEEQMTKLQFVKLGVEKFNETHVENIKDKNVKLEVKDLQVSFRTQAGILKAVRQISFDLNKGETFAIVGESGSGKSVTSKAIIGILSGNSIVEGGEILYDGQDLLKISEDDYHKIRGDKIAMIFQDPMSSLNPIMRVGKQLTEAMILKSKSGRKNARRAFNAKLKRLQQNIDEANKDNPNYNPKHTAEQIKLFDKFCINNTVIEGQYNDAMAHTIETEFIIDNFIFLVSRKQKVDVQKTIAKVLKNVKESIHPFVLVDSATLQNHIANLTNLQKNKNVSVEVVINEFNAVKELAHQATLKEKPNFFTLAYYQMINPNNDVTNMPVKELNEMTREYLDNNFMIQFIKLAESGALYAYKQSIQAKQELLDDLYELYGYFSLDEISKRQSKKRLKVVAKKVSQAIDRLNVKKNSTEYVFGSAAMTELNRYFDGIKSNPKELKKYNRNKAKYDSLIAKGKTLDWTLKPLVQVDLDLTIRNLRKVVEYLIASYNKDIEFYKDGKFNKEEVNNYVIQIVDYLKEQASKVVAKLTKKLAKAQAIKLLEEVGIPEPTIRYNQFPFEFSGGMRQRIVIAIALSANPDILICDEPTTALDVTIQSQILELINKIKVERNLSVIFITHNLGVVANMADRIAVMYAGKIVEHGLSEEIFYEPKHPYTWALLSSMPDLHTKDRLDSIPGTPPNMIFPPKGDAFAARNKYALKVDFEIQPPLFKVSETHYAATWLLHPDAPKVEMPKIIRDRVERLQKEMDADGR